MKDGTSAWALEMMSAGHRLEHESMPAGTGYFYVSNGYVHCQLKAIPYLHLWVCTVDLFTRMAQETGWSIKEKK